MTDWNTGSCTTGVNADIYYGSDPSWNNPYYWQGSPPVTVITRIVEVPAQDSEIDRKENDMIQRQTFLDALGDEGKSIDSEGRDIIKEAKAEKWELFIARLLARAFESADLVMLKEKPKEVLVKEA